MKNNLLESPVSHTKFRGNRSTGSGEEKFVKMTHYYLREAMFYFLKQTTLDQVQEMTLALNACIPPIT